MMARCQRVRGLRIRGALLALFGVTSLGAVAPWIPSTWARPVDVPSFSAGPRITAAGLVWLSSTGPRLTRAGGASVPLPGAGALPVTSPTSSWEALATSTGVRAGRLGGVLAARAPLRRCPALRGAGAGSNPTAAQPRLLALSGSRLFAAVEPRCLHRRGYGRAALLVEDLRTHSWKLLAAIAPGAAGLVASGARVAVTYPALLPAAASAPTRPLTVVVYEARTGRRIYAVRAPNAEIPNRSLTTAVDEFGDVLVTATSFHPPAPGSRGWWATPGSPREHDLPQLATAGQVVSNDTAQAAPALTGAAAISRGRIAYVRGGPHAGERIELLDLRADATSTVARFPGEVGVLGLDLAGEELAWAQQSTLPEGSGGPLPKGGSFFSCKVRALEPPQLTSVGLRTVPAGGLLVGKPLPAADRPPCTDFEK